MKLVYSLALVVLTTGTNATAFHLNPENRSYSTAASDKHFLNKISQPVHEALTRKAREVYWDKCSKQLIDGIKCSEVRDIPATINDSLIRGVWWSDDPNQDLYQARQINWIRHMFDAKRRAKSGHYKIDGRYMMQYRSHYGDMQFLHAMASEDGEEANTTKRHVLMWAEFLYKITTNKFGRETKFRDVTVNGLSVFFERQSDWELSWILQPRFHLKRSDDFREHALGVLLHMIQDSYSESHVERVFAATEKCPSGYINQFLSYTHQNSTKHGKADTWAGYEASKLPTGANPIDVGAQIIWFARNNADWSREVMPYLDTTVFCLAENPKSAGAGRY